MTAILSSLTNNISIWFESEINLSDWQVSIAGFSSYLIDRFSSDRVLWVLTGIFLLLIISSLTVRILAASNSEKNYTELQDRVNSWWIIVGIFATSLLVSKTVAIVFFASVSFIALKEYFSLIPTRKVDRRVLFWAYLAILIQYYWIYIHWYGMFLIFIPVYVFLFLPMRMVLLGETQGFLKAVGTLHWGLMLTVFCLSHVAYLLNLPEQGNPVAAGGGLLLYLIILTSINDIAQYIWGKSFGSHQIVPTVSPNKTWEGFIGGVLTTTTVAVLLSSLLTPFDLIHALAIGLLIGMTGFIGDVTISSLKRDLGVKDSGNLIPGHGGILDRIDSLTYTAPLFFHFTVYFYFRGTFL
jgi:phosphatidate cytidylyltransferase